MATHSVEWLALISTLHLALARYLRGGDGWRPYSLREVSAELAQYGYLTRRGQQYSAGAVKAMLEV